VEGQEFGQGNWLYVCVRGIPMHMMTITKSKELVIKLQQ
jgi:hypothetical protein